MGKSPPYAPRLLWFFDAGVANLGEEAVGYFFWPIGRHGGRLGLGGQMLLRRDSITSASVLLGACSGFNLRRMPNGCVASHECSS